MGAMTSLSPASRLFTQPFVQAQKTSKLRDTGLCEGNSPVTGEFPTQRASNVENVSIWWRHHDLPSTENDTSASRLELKNNFLSLAPVSSLR